MLASVNGELHTIDSFLKNGLPDADLFIISGILRGTGLVYKECVAQKRDFLFIDHAYFNKGYEHPTWMRVTKNRHVFGPSLTYSSGSNYDKFKKPSSDWMSNRGNQILVFPPTHAISWLFDADEWEEKTIAEIKKHTDRPIKVRSKPNNPIVDTKGNLLRIESTKDTPLEEDLKNTYAAVIYNSNAAIECLRAGIPVVASENCCAFPVTCTFDQFESKIAEPNRQQLFMDLAQAQFTKLEMTQGIPYQRILENR